MSHHHIMIRTKFVYKLTPPILRSQKAYKFVTYVGDPKIPGIVTKKLLKNLYNFENFVPFPQRIAGDPQQHFR